MAALYDNHFQNLVTYNKKTSLYQVWKMQTMSMTDDEYKREMLLFAKYLEYCQPQKLLINTNQLIFKASSKIQEWTQREIYFRLEPIPLKKIAFVLPYDQFAEKSDEEINGFLIKYPPQAKVKFFTEEYEAISWLGN